MSDIELITYVLVFAVSVIFSAYTVERESPLFSFLSALCWFVLAMTHLSLAYASDLIILAFLFVAFGLIFTIYGIAKQLLRIREATEHKKWSVPL